MTSAVYCGHRGTYVYFYGHFSVLVKKIFLRKFCSYTCTLALNADDDDEKKILPIPLFQEEQLPINGSRMYAKYW